MRKVIHIHLRCVFVNKETDIQCDFYKISMAYLSFLFFTLNKYAENIKRNICLSWHSPCIGLDDFLGEFYEKYNFSIAVFTISHLPCIC